MVKHYHAHLYGRLKGAIGILYWIDAEVDGENPEDARLRLYDRFEHIPWSLHLTEIQQPQLLAAGVPLDSHESDLYAKVSPESHSILAGYVHQQNVTVFRSQVDGCRWFSIPFAYDPFWEGKSR